MVISFLPREGGGRHSNPTPSCRLSSSGLRSVQAAVCCSSHARLQEVQGAFAGSLGRHCQPRRRASWQYGQGPFTVLTWLLGPSTFEHVWLMQIQAGDPTLLWGPGLKSVLPQNGNPRVVEDSPLFIPFLPPLSSSS